MPLRPLACTLLFVLLTPTPAPADSVTISPIKDNTLFADSSGALSSGAGQHFFAGNNSVSNTRRGVIAFDVAANLPAQAMIDSVTLVLFVSGAPNDTPQQVTLHRLLSDWGEGTSTSGGGAGAASTPDDATWIHTFYSSQFWSTVGGDFDAAVSASAVIAGDGSYTWSGPGMTADVQHWLETPQDDYGWLLQGDEGGPSTVRRFDSRENTVAGNRPILIIYYTPDTTPVRTLTWGASKALYRE